MMILYLSTHLIMLTLSIFKDKFIRIFEKNVYFATSIKKIELIVNKQRFLHATKFSFIKDYSDVANGQLLPVNLL